MTTQKQTVKTNRYKFNVDWDAFFQQFRMFQIEVACEKEKHRSVYDQLSSLPAQGKPISVSYGWAKDQGRRMEYYMMAPCDCKLSERNIKDALAHVDFIDCKIEEIQHGDSMPPMVKVANLLLSYLPNYDGKISYADGQLYLGGCHGWSKHLRRYGELAFLNVSFKHGGPGILCLSTCTVNFTSEKALLSSKYYKNINLQKVKENRPFYVNYDAASVHAMRLAEQEPYYNLKAEERQYDNIRIDFLAFKDKDAIDTCQAARALDVIESMKRAYASFLDIDQLDYVAECMESKSGGSHVNKIEEAYMAEFLARTTFLVKVFDQKSSQCLSTAFAVKSVLNKLKLKVGEDIAQNTAVFRVMPSWADEKERLKNKSRREVLETKQPQRIDKIRYQEQGVPVQDVTTDTVKEASTSKDPDYEKTIYNLLRQLCVKGYVLRGELPAVIAERYKGTTIIYGEKKPYGGEYEMVKASIDADGATSYEFGTCNSDGGYVIFDGVKLQSKYLTGGLSLGNLYWMKVGDLEMQIFDTPEFVFPNVDYIKQWIQEGKKTCSLKNDGIRDLAFGAFIGAHYWQDEDSNWCYASGPRPKSLKGTYVKISNKTHIRHLRANRPTTAEEMNQYVVSNLEEGWRKKNENSSHPSIYKFLYEALEIYRTKLIAAAVLD